MGKGDRDKEREVRNFGFTDSGLERVFVAVASVVK